MGRRADIRAAGVRLWCSFQIRSESERQGYTDQMSQDRHHSLVTATMKPITCLLAVTASLALAAPVHAQVDCSDWNTAVFFEAAEVSDVTRCLQAGANLEARDGSGYTPLHWAAHFGNVEAVEALLAAGADPNAQDRGFFTPLHNAASSGNVKTVMVLLEAGAYLEARFVDGGPPLHVAKTAEVVTALLEAGADPHTRTRYGVTPLHAAQSAGVVTALVEAGVDPNVRTTEGGSTPLHSAASAEVVTALLGSGRRSGGARCKRR